MGNSSTERSPVRDQVSGRAEDTAVASTAPVRTHVAKPCQECRVNDAFHATQSRHLPPSFNVAIDFTSIVNIPASKRAVIELVTASISVPPGERARLRMFTSLGFAPSNLDFVLIPQGQVGGQEVLIATHSIRAYSDHLIEFNVNRDNPVTEGDALICISGYLIDV